MKECYLFIFALLASWAVHAQTEIDVNAIGTVIADFSVPTITSVTHGSCCETGTVTLGATASAGIINWYSTPTGGTSLGTGTSFTTPNQSLTTIYYVDATDNGYTTETRTSVTATVNSIPHITAAALGARCGTGTVILEAYANAGTINWYSEFTGGVSLGTGKTFITPSLTSTTNYYVDATLNGCTSEERSPIAATVYPYPTITGTTTGSRCDEGTVTLGATASAGKINWYSESTGSTTLGTGTTFTTPILSSTTVYYVDAIDYGCVTTSRTAITATIAVPTITSTISGSTCGTGTVILGATAISGDINWYSTPTGGTSLGTGTSFTTPNLSSTTVYYVDATDNTCTTATRTSVTATVNSIPHITAAALGARCGTGTVILEAYANAGTINWYSEFTGGVSLGTGKTFITPSLTSTTNYYVDATLNGCTSEERSPIAATVYPYPTITGTTPGSFCGTGAVTLSATASAGLIDWYSASTGGSSLGTGTSFTTPNLTSTTAYYVDATDHGCTTMTRTLITVKDNCPVGINTISISGIIKIYPNPVKDIIYISIDVPLESDYRIELLNSNGILIKTIPMDKDENNTLLDLSAYPVALYMVKIVTNKDYYLYKIIKE